jgi:hypothetical protein
MQVRVDASGHVVYGRYAKVVHAQVDALWYIEQSWRDELKNLKPVVLERRRDA